MLRVVQGHGGLLPGIQFRQKEAVPERLGEGVGEFLEFQCMEDVLPEHVV